jgi:hypothetical protein
MGATAARVVAAPATNATPAAARTMTPTIDRTSWLTEVLLGAAPAIGRRRSAEDQRPGLTSTMARGGKRGSRSRAAAADPENRGATGEIASAPVSTRAPGVLLRELDHQ